MVPPALYVWGALYGAWANPGANVFGANKIGGKVSRPCPGLLTRPRLTAGPGFPQSYF